MTVDYIVASLPPLEFGVPPAIDEERFAQLAGGRIAAEMAKWRELETELRNAMAVARGKAKDARPAKGCSLYWRQRIAACFQEKDIAKRDELLDKVWWDAALELVPPSAPLGKGALAAYGVRLAIACKRARISSAAGADAFDALTAGSKLDFN